jgi:hypothetical protein
VTADSGTTRSIGVDATLQCPRCRATLPLAGPVLHARCHRCSEQIAIPQLLWLQTLSELDEQSYDAGTTRTSAGSCRRDHDGVLLALEWARGEPACRRCGGVVPQIEPGASGETQCPACQAPLSTFPAPPWVRTEIPTALQVYGVEYVFDAVALEGPARRFWISFQGTPPRKAAAHKLLIEQEIVVHSQRMPQPKESSLHLLPLLLALAVIGLAAYYVVSAMSKGDTDELIVE